MKRLAWLLLLPLASGALFGQTGYSITGDGSERYCRRSYSASLQTNPQALCGLVLHRTLPPGLNMTTGSSYVRPSAARPLPPGAIPSRSRPASPTLMLRSW